MNPIKTIRERLGVTQAVLAQAIGRTQGNVAFYERGQSVPSDVAKRLIVFAAKHGVQLSYDDIYGPAITPIAQPATENVAQEAV